MSETPWFVYVVRCVDGTFYTGVATDTARREKEHNESPKGARYTRARRPVRIVHQEEYANRSEACARESAIKQLSRAEKEALVAVHFPI